MGGLINLWIEIHKIAVELLNLYYMGFLNTMEALRIVIKKEI